MNERLMKHVERAVRPVRAPRERKLQMREELLAHLTALYDDERERCESDNDAFAAATARFGDPALLAAELNASVGPWQRAAWMEERWLLWFESWFVFRPDRSLRTNLVRTGASLGLMIVLLFAVMIGLFMVLVPERRDDPDGPVLLAKVAALAAASACLMLWATQTILSATRGLSRRAALWTVLRRGFLWALGLVAASSAFWWATVGRMDAILAVLPYVALSELTLMPALLVCIWALARSEEEYWRRHREWTTLQLDE